MIREEHFWRLESHLEIRSNIKKVDITNADSKEWIHFFCMHKHMENDMKMSRNIEMMYLNLESSYAKLLSSENCARTWRDKSNKRSMFSFTLFCYA